jgi:hypothetical protein
MQESQSVHPWQALPASRIFVSLDEESAGVERLSVL